MTSQKNLLIVSVVFFFMTFFVHSVYAVTELDSSFGDQGAVVEDFGFGDDVILDAEVQLDGKILVAGYSNNGAVTNVIVSRYLEDGTLDNSFNDDGIFNASLGNSNSKANSLVLQSDGKIVLSCTIDGAENQVVLLRLTTEGFPDAAFGENGQAEFSIDNHSVKASKAQLTSSGDIVVAGFVSPEGDDSYAYISKFTTTGQRDETFGEEGVVRIEKNGAVDLRTLEVIEGDKIVTAATVTSEGKSSLILLRLNEDGSNDTSFGNNGESTTNFTADILFINGSFSGSGGTLFLAGGQGNAESTDAIVIKLDAEGNPVLEFGDGGLYQSNLGGNSFGNAVAVLDGGQIAMAGAVSLSQEDGQDLFVEIIDESGKPQEITIDAGDEESEETETLSSNMDEQESDDSDSSEENQDTVVVTKEASSFVTTDLSSNDDIGYALIVSPDGGIIVAGASGNGSDDDFVLLRYLSSDESVLTADSTTTGVVTGEYRIETRTVVDVSRVSAVSGGIITDTRKLSCETGCTADCQDEGGALDQTCYDTCLETCQSRPTIALRGVVYAVYDLPVYEADEGGSEDEEEGDGDEGDEEEGDNEGDDSDGNDTEETIDVEESQELTEAITDSILSQSEDGGNIFPQGFTIPDAIVRSGQTEDGSGLGPYSSDIQDISPNTFYYVRAYAVLTDDTVIYGNVLSFQTADACFIATAAFGSILDKHVYILREFRDQVLMQYSIGEQLVGLYYRVSPVLANVIEESEALRAVTRVGLYPLVLGAAMFLHLGLVLKIVVSFCMFVLMFKMVFFRYVKEG